jgi:hypothetical protein
MSRKEKSSVVATRAYSRAEAMLRKAPADPRTPEQIAQIEAARVRGRASAAVRPRDAKGRLLPKGFSVDAMRASPDAPVDASIPDTTTDAPQDRIEAPTAESQPQKRRPPQRYKGKLPPGPKPKRTKQQKARSARAKARTQATRKEAERVKRQAKALAKSVMGAPSLYNDETVTAILDAIAAGASLPQACKPLKINWQTVWNWKARYPDFRSAYEQAVKERADAHAEEIIDIADNDDDDVIRVIGPRGNEIVVQNTVGVQRAKLKIQARQWSMGKVQPEKYGDIKTIRDERHP